MKAEQWSFSASNSIWPIVCIYIPCPNPSPAFPVMPQQMPDIEVESEQLFPLLHGCIILHNLLSFALPSPTAKIKKPLPLTLASSSLSVCRFILSGPLVPSEDPVYCFRPGAAGTPGPGGVVRSCPPSAARSLWGQRVRAARRGRAPHSLPGPVNSPKRCKSVSSSRRPYLFLHLLQLLVDNVPLRRNSNLLPISCKM